MTYNKKVISFIKLQGVWRYWDFVYLNDSNPIEAWYEALPEDIQDAFDALLKTKHPLQWTGFRKYLHGGDLKKHGVWELEFKGQDGLAHRLMGVFNGPKTAIFLIGCYQKGGNYTPPEALKTAATRAALLAQEKAKTRERTVKTDI